jgi:pimeloyl-ACP methyl ester carboxylesterase/DNA-binding SARP family transcriptional activator
LIIRGRYRRDTLDVRVRIWLCGGLRVELDGVRSEHWLRRRKSRELLAVLLDRDTAISRDELVELLWPDSPPGRRAGQLRVLLTELRQTLGADALEGRSELRLTLPADAWIDLRAGAEALEQCRAAVAERRWGDVCVAAERAAALLDQQFLVGHDGDWIAVRRRALEQQALEAIEALAAASLTQMGQEAVAVQAARTLVARAPFRENGTSLLMRALVAAGNPSDAVRAFDGLRQLLSDELGTIPSVALSALNVWVLEQQNAASDEREDPQTRYARRPDGVAIAYQTLGSGPVDFVVVPGFMSHLDAQWAIPAYRRWLRELSASMRVITLDKAGTGASDAIEGTPSMADWAGDVLSVLDEVGSGRVVVFGMSEGAAVAVAFATRHPERVRGLVFYGAMARALPREGYLWEHREAIEAAIARFAEIELSWGSGGSAEVWAPTAARTAAERRAWAVFERASGSPASIARRSAALLATDVCDDLPDLRAPTLVLHRSGDRIVPVHHGRHFGAVIPGARYVELEGVDHVPFLGDAETLTAEIRAFVATLARRS